MKFITLVTAIAVTSAPALAQNYQRVTSEADYIAKVVGTTYCNETGCWSAKKNGRMTGKFGKDRLRATWKWHEGFACQVGKLGKRQLETDCRIIEVAGNKLRIRSNQGRGGSRVYTAK